MNSVWTNIESHIIKLINAQTMMILGLDGKSNTHEILDFCKKNHIKVSLVDSIPNFEVEELEDKFKGIMEIYKEPVINRLSIPNNYDVILMNNTQDWQETYSALKLIQKNCKKFPLLFVHDICITDLNEESTENVNDLEKFKTPVKGAVKAINDFIKESDEKLSMATVPLSTGVAILYPENLQIKKIWICSYLRII